MKKIFLSLLFLFLISVSSNSFAQTLGCVGNAQACASRSSAAECSGVPSANGTTAIAAVTGNGNCSWTANGPCAGNAGACSTITSAAACNTVPGCSFISVGNANNNAFVTTLCNALKIVTGNGGKAFAAFAIISCGIGFFTGKISWGLMIGITAGIAAMFGAPTIVAAIAGGNALDCAAGSNS